MLAGPTCDPQRYSYVGAVLTRMACVGKGSKGGPYFAVVECCYCMSDVCRSRMSDVCIVRFIKNVPFGDLPWEISGGESL